MSTRRRRRRRKGFIGNREYIQQFKKDVPCVDCDIHFPPPLMTFDHCRGTKKFGLGSVGNRRLQRKKMDAEIAKCDVVCRPCHDEREHSRFCILLWDLPPKLCLDWLAFPRSNSYF